MLFQRGVQLNDYARSSSARPRGRPRSRTPTSGCRGIPTTTRRDHPSRRSASRSRRRSRASASARHSSAVRASAASSTRRPCRSWRFRAPLHFEDDCPHGQRLHAGRAPRREERRREGRGAPRRGPRRAPGARRTPSREGGANVGGEGRKTTESCGTSSKRSSSTTGEQTDTARPESHTARALARRESEQVSELVSSGWWDRFRTATAEGQLAPVLALVAPREQ